MSYDKYNETMPTRIRELIAEKGITQNAIAKEIGVSRQSISQYCDGSSTPNADKLLRLAQYFNVSADYILGLTDAKTNDKDIQTISDYTGLDANVISLLNDNVKSGYPSKTTSVLNSIFTTFHYEDFFRNIFYYLNLESMNVYNGNDCINTFLGHGFDKEEQEQLFNLIFHFDNEQSSLIESIDSHFWEPHFLMATQQQLIKIKNELMK